MDVLVGRARAWLAWLATDNMARDSWACSKASPAAWRRGEAMLPSLSKSERMDDTGDIWILTARWSSQYGKHRLRPERKERNKAGIIVAAAWAQRGRTASWE